MSGFSDPIDWTHKAIGSGTRLALAAVTNLGLLAIAADAVAMR
jgi:hypothetical protein